MEHRIKEVKTLDDCILLVVFRNGVEVKYDLKQLYSRFPQFQILEKDKQLFESVQVDTGGYGVSWNDELDLEAEEIWESGVQTGKVYELNISQLVAENLIKARYSLGITQKELSEKVSMYQADISKIENGNANPSIQTLDRLAKGMGMHVEIKFVKK